MYARCLLFYEFPDVLFHLQACSSLWGKVGVTSEILCNADGWDLPHGLTVMPGVGRQDNMMLIIPM